MRDGLLERALKSGAKAAANALPKGTAAQYFRPADITFPTVSRNEKALPAAQYAEQAGGAAEFDTAALSQALMLESLRYGRYLEAQVSG